MLTVKTELKNSSVAGLGVFATEFIQKGALVWIFAEDLDRVFTRDDVNIFSKDECVFLYKYATIGAKHLDTLILAVDNARFINHSDTPNIEYSKSGGVVEYPCKSLRDIRVGEEITQNYNEFQTGDFVGIWHQIMEAWRLLASHEDRPQFWKGI